MVYVYAISNILVDKLDKNNNEHVVPYPITSQSLLIL